MAGSLAGALVASPTLHFNDWDIGLISGFYLAGAVVGALVFGWLTDRYGRNKLFFITLGLYAAATAATAFSFNLASFCLFRFLTGAGIGGEYSAINSTIQEFTPARLRGRIDMAINGSFWIGGALGAAASIYLLNPAHFIADMGWRAAFFIGALWRSCILVTTDVHSGKPALACHPRTRKKGRSRSSHEIEAEFSARNIALSDPKTLKPLRIRPRKHTPLTDVFRRALRYLSCRTLVGLALMSGAKLFLQRNLLHLRICVDDIL